MAKRHILAAEKFNFQKFGTTISSTTEQFHKVQEKKCSDAKEDETDEDDIPLSKLKFKLSTKNNGMAYGKKEYKSRFIEILSDDEEDLKIRLGSKDANVPLSSTFNNSKAECIYEDQSVTSALIDKDFESSNCKIISADG